MLKTTDRNNAIDPLTKSGFIPDEITEDQWMLGGTNSVDAPVLSSGHWFLEGHIPEGEIQRNDYIDTYGCTSFQYTNCIEVLWHAVFGEFRNFSDRWLYIISRTRPPGNTQHNVAESARKSGLIDEFKLPFTKDITSIDAYAFPDPPTQELVNLANEFLSDYELAHDWVDSDPETLKTMLKHSPLGVAVSAWFQGDDGLYYFPPGLKPNHATTLIDYEDGEYWLILDSYPDSEGSYLKKLRWDAHLPYKSKRYAILATDKKKISLIKQILEYLKDLLGLTQEVKAIIEKKEERVVKDREYFVNYAKTACRNVGLSDLMTSRLLRTIEAESNWDPRAVNANTDGTTDYGICQYNSYWYIGPGKPIPSVDVALNNPEFCIEVMAKQFKKGRANDWIAYRKLIA